MSNRDGGHFDGAGNYWPPYSEPPAWRRWLSSAIAWVLFAAFLIGVGAFAVSTWRDGAPVDDPVYYDPSRRGWTQ